MMIKPTCQTACELHNKRSGNISEYAGDWASGLTTIMLMLGSGTADAGDEGLCCVREGDLETNDSSTHSREAWLHLQKYMCLSQKEKSWISAQVTRHT